MATVGTSRRHLAWVLLVLPTPGQGQCLGLSSTLHHTAFCPLCSLLLGAYSLPKRALSSSFFRIPTSDRHLLLLREHSPQPRGPRGPYKLPET